MSVRQIVLDTETTGLRVEDGHRIIEIGCIELVDRRVTGQNFHVYMNPEREIDPGAIAVHGITNEYLADKPFFSAIATEFMDFVNGAEIIIHNAPFDLSFINHELTLVKKGWQALTNYCPIIDTLVLARQRHIGQRNSLDALCKRYGVDNSKREYHGALLDAHLLAQVYLAMTGGQGSFFDAIKADSNESRVQTEASVKSPTEIHDLKVIPASQEDLAAHAAYLSLLAKKGNCIWE